ncbi:MAG: ABC transporter substrate-binding protein [Thiolinea sp.]
MSKTLNASAAVNTRQINFQSSWVNDAEFMGYFVALHEQYYRQQKITMDYFPGGPNIIPETLLLTGKAHIALTTIETAVKIISQHHAPFRIIGTQYQRNPIGILSRADNPVRSFQELAGKTLAVPPTNMLAVHALMRLNKLTRKDVRIIPYTYDPTPLINKEIDASVDFIVNVAHVLTTKGVTPVSFLLCDYGYPSFNDTLVVSEHTLKNRRNDVIQWLRASRQGWEKNFKDPTFYPPLFAHSWFKGTGRSINHETFFNIQQKPLIEHPNGIFHMTKEDIEENISALRNMNIQAKTSMFDTSLLKEI